VEKPVEKAPVDFSTPHQLRLSSALHHRGATRCPQLRGGGSKPGTLYCIHSSLFTDP